MKRNLIKMSLICLATVFTMASQMKEVKAVEDITEVIVTSEEGEEVKIAKSNSFKLKEEYGSYKEILKHVGVVSCEDKVNVRSSATTKENNIVGKAYNNAIVIVKDIVEEEDGIWYKIVSGNVEGYIRSDKVLTGKRARNIAEEMFEEKGIVQVETLNLRKEPNVECEIIGTLKKGGTCTIKEMADNGFVKVEISDGTIGYVAFEYLTVENNVEWALTLEEYEVRLAEEAEAQRLEQARKDAKYIQSLMQNSYNNYVAQLNAEWFRKAQGFAQEYVSYAQKLVALGNEYGFSDIVAYGNDAISKGNSYIAHTQAKIAGVESALAAQQAQRPAPQQPAPQQPVQQKPTNVTSSNVSAIRQAIVAEALKWPGKCRYVWGGTNLTVGGGVDCSGFTLSIYRNVAGITLKRTSAAQSTMGRRVALNAVQPGDLIFYYGSSGIGHVAIYIGNGQIVHAKNPNAGIGIDSMYYTKPAWAVSIF